MTKYDWSNVPKEVRFIVTDENGLKYGHQDKPKLSDMLGLWYGLDFIRIGRSEFKGDWQDSLEERPLKSDLPETVVKSLGEVA
ncbi:hypothetical protein ACG904_09655 [Acinetobacter guillouiae]|uniref:hypothetical protein n=1 Tax=Acinetobacter guillouiae TaxID=106649 RepID=UPI003AF93459